MDHIQTFRHQVLETVVKYLQRRYPAFCPLIVENSPEQGVIQLDQFTITITYQGTVEVAAPTNSHKQVERLAVEIEQILDQANAPSQGQVDQ